MTKYILLVFALFTFALPAWCQCGGATQNWGDGFVRVDGNTLYYSAFASLTGNGDEDNWYSYVNVTGYNSSDDGEFSPNMAEVDYTNTLQTIGPGTYTELAEFQFTDEDDDLCDYDPPDDTQNITIQRPTISGFCCGNSFWNLGYGSSDPQPTWPPGGSKGSGSYAQSVALTFVSNCSTCSSTPTWSLTTSNQQTQLPGGEFTATGSSTTISKGSSNYATCSADSVLTASIDGFSSDNYPVIVDGPIAAYNISYGGVPYQTTGLYSTDGYNTQWSMGILDECGTQYLYALPVAEAFSYLSLENGATGYGFPPGSSYPYWDYTDWENSYIFVDQIGQCGTSCRYSPSPVPTYTTSSPPYTYSTVYLDGTHYFNAGTTTAAYGVPVYDGAIQYFQDHGDNNP